jgi:hypothetical protein
MKSSIVKRSICIDGRTTNIVGYIKNSSSMSGRFFVEIANSWDDT